MAKDKKGFILYADLIKVVSKLPDETAGKLFKIVLSYVNDLEVNIDDLLLEIAFEPIKNQLKRDLVKFEGVKDERSRSGQLGNLKRYHLDLYNKVKSEDITIKEAQSIANSRKDSHSDTKLAVNDNDNVNVNDISINIDNKKYLDIILKDAGYIEITAMQTKSNLETVIKYLKDFEAHLIRTSDQKNTIRDFKTHFTNWFNKQDIKKIVKIKKIDYGNVN